MAKKTRRIHYLALASFLTLLLLVSTFFDQQDASPESQVSPVEKYVEDSPALPDNKDREQRRLHVQVKHDEQDAKTPGNQQIAKDERYMELAAKSLLTSQEKNEFTELINNPEWQQQQIDRLKLGHTTKYDRTEEKQRMQSIEILAQTLVYGNDQSRETVRLALIQLIEDRSYLKLRDKRLQKSFIGDKVEQLVLLHKLSPQSFAEMSHFINESDDQILKFALRSANNLQGSLKH
ncbi:MAG: hypothetical protein ACOH5I_16565 [Oligoflexus sp.]